MLLWHTKTMQAIRPQSIHLQPECAQVSLAHAQSHYENFPVASILLPKHLRTAVAVIYRFARLADDIADEGDVDEATRLAQLQALKDELLLIEAYIQPNTPFFLTLQQVIRQHRLPVSLFLDLLDAFSQDVVKTRYADFNEVLDYCRRSANPIGRLLLHLNQQASPQHLAWSDNICTALQLINFYQDVAIDLEKHNGIGRIYISHDELAHAGITEDDLRAQNISPLAMNPQWQALFAQQLQRAEHLLQQGKPLGKQLKGRFGIEIRMIIASAERIIGKLHRSQGDVFRHRPTLNKFDGPMIVLKALFKK